MTETAQDRPRMTPQAVAKLLHGSLDSVFDAIATADLWAVNAIDSAEVLGLGRLTVRRHILRRRRELFALLANPASAPA